ncbi:NAD-glutamate dehydrogenase [Janibacter alkaliphilus]|uniref:Glutamate dehydrogenase n=1 Tax=Janibacter alkaliphilus TaxID=1069963 RepID=A0A852X2D2_9MICO|nr:NAD-glutamate dehydrogenase [Janibacter alkaliphilus]NYG37492.1 glutamate dehydrogenase [Janibacter alkaliphilus]
MAQPPAETARDDEGAATAASGEPDPAFVARYTRHVADDLLADTGAESLAAMARVHREMARSRPDGQTLVAVDDGVLHIVTDDRPFLVDSVLGALAHDGVDVGLMLHPRFVVRRDEHGTLTQILDEEPEAGQGESWIRIAVDPAVDPEQLRQRVVGVLADVRAAVDDWQPMRRSIIELADRLPEDTRIGTADERDAAASFLRWLAEDHLTFLGCRDHVVEIGPEGPTVRALPGTGMGVLRDDDAAEAITPLALGEEHRQEVEHPVTVGKSEQVLAVHRVTHPDLVAVRYHDAGRLIERRYAGQFSSTAYTSSVLTIPLVADKVRAILDEGGWSTRSHSGAIVMRLLETFPRDELFQAPLDHLRHVVTRILQLANQLRTAVFLRRDPGGRFVTALVYLPRERYTTSVRRQVEHLLRGATGADRVTFTAHVSDEPLARLYYVLRSSDGAVTMPDAAAEERLDDDIADAARTWEDRLHRTAARLVGDTEARRLVLPWRGGFPVDYEEDFDAAQTLADLKNLARLGDGPDEERFACALYDPRRGHGGGDDPAVRRFKLFSIDTPTLTDVMPVFRDLGVDVIDEEPYLLRRTDGVEVGIYDFSLRVDDPGLWEQYSHEQLRELVESTLTAVWRGQAESDGLNALVIRAGLSWREVALVRALVAYLRQTGVTWGTRSLISALVENHGIARDLVALFEARFDPETGGTGPARATAEQEVLDRIEAALEEVASLDHDRILRALVGLVQAVIRTSYFVRDAQGRPLPRMSFKLLPERVPDLRKPHPAFEIWVHSPQVEGVHLRFGAVARGGLRWSDRRDDFRTEILGLVKAQLVKNVVIVPTGSKGGFYAKQLPDPAEGREAYQDAGRAAYRSFISGLLDITDNRVEGQVVPPAQVVRHDGDDPYLVVAADKGTATFSDLANEVSQEYGFWLDDAFASGGSIGYDHKAMGITARGAWESVRRHFREMGHDTQTEDFTVAGIGDMSGDVFGNGMLLSEHIRLVAAFDHRHVFVDPDPDAATSFAERQRLFGLERSTWEDYDASLISAGGGVWSRSLKRIEISPQMRAALGLAEEVTELTPSELIHEILQAPVDLLWFGGIGTYVRSAGESDSEVGDRANDAVRVQGSQLRAKVVGEGGNLGVTQPGRIEAAEAGVRINTDAIDNSAGVDTSDHEVNIKILLGQAKADGALDEPGRVELLESMTEEVADQVLRDNYEQNVLLGNARAQQGSMLGVHTRFMHSLEERGLLERELEDLPSDAELAERVKDGRGLSSPELAVLLAYAKIALSGELLDSDLPDDPATAQHLSGYFPQPVRERFGGDIEAHPLRREIIATSIANDLVNRGGITFVYRATEETAARPAEVTRAYLVAREIFGLSEYVAQVEALDTQVPTELQTHLYLEFRRLLDRACRWFLAARPGRLDIAAEIERLGPAVRVLAPRLPEMLCGDEAERLSEDVAELVDAGVPSELARWSCALLDLYSVLDITDLAHETGEDPMEVARVYYTVSEAFGVDALLNAVSSLPREELWDGMARGALREDLYATLESLTSSVLAHSPDAGGDAQDRLQRWSADHEESVGRATTAIASIRRLDTQSIASLSVALRTLRSVTR